jgi:hypothetical protein
MNTPGEVREGIARNAKMVDERASAEMRAPCMYGRAAVVWLEGHIRMLRTEIEKVPAEREQSEVDALGGVLYPFFGECIAHAYEGQWVFVNNQYWGISLHPKADVTLFPQKQVYGALGGDSSKSPLAMFDFIAREYLGQRS